MKLRSLPPAPLTLPRYVQQGARSSARMLTVVAALLAAGGCATAPTVAKNPLQASQEAERAYEDAMRAFQDHDWETAKTKLEDVKHKYAGGHFARLAELRLVDIDFEQENYAEAITAYRAFTKDHKLDEGVPYARFRIAKALYGEISDSLLLPPQEERDQNNILGAYNELMSFIDAFPASKYLNEARFMLFSVSGRLARHEMYVARYYMNRGIYEPAIRRLNHALRDYESSGMEPEALVMLAEAYLRLDRKEDASLVLHQLLAAYPTSPFIAQGKRYLQQLETATPPG